MPSKIHRQQIVPSTGTSTSTLACTQCGRAQRGKSQIEYISKHFVVSCCLSTPWWWHAAVNGLANGATGTRVYEFRLVKNSKITIFGHYDYLGRNDRCRFRCGEVNVQTVIRFALLSASGNACTKKCATGCGCE